MADRFTGRDAGMVFVADDLGAWLVGALADAGRKRLTALVFGSEQDRALRQAATAAVQHTARELRPEGGERAEGLAMVVSQVFSKPMPDAPMTVQTPLLEMLQAGIAGQLAVLDDASLTGTGKSAAQVLGVPATVLAGKLTDCLVRQIIFRGAHGGPLAPLAAQLNHDMTHLQGQRLEGIVWRLAEELGVVSDGARATALLARPAAGRPLGEVTDPFTLEVHRPLELDDPQAELPALPVYVPRQHDQELGRVVRAAAEGNSKIAVLVGGRPRGRPGPAGRP